MNLSLLILLSYLIGSIPFAVVISRCMGLAHPNSYGSRNPGATNVLRSGNKYAAFFTLIGDGLKGYLVTYFAQHYAAIFEVSSINLALIIIAVFLGHTYPLFLRFCGGKGVATGAGIVFGLNFYFGVFSTLVWIGVALIMRYSSLAGIATAIFVVVGSWFFLGAIPCTYALSLMGIFLIYRHRHNLKQWFNGKEEKIIFRK